MRPSVRLALRSGGLALALLGFSLTASDPAQAGRKRPPAVSHEEAGHLTFTSPQSNPIVACADGSRVFVAATTSNRVDVIDTSTNTVTDTVAVGMEPVGLAIHPVDGDSSGCGDELYVTNHVSDTVSVIDLVETSGDHLNVVDTIQELDANGATLFDEPVGVAFNGAGTQAYVTLSSINDVAIIDTATRAVVGRLHVTNQDPRAIVVRDDVLYVAAFESGNQTETSMCEFGGEDPDPNDCTLIAQDAGEFAMSPNLAGFTKNIDFDPDMPDRDLFVWDVSTPLVGGEAPDDVVEHVGTLLYGMAVAANGDVFVTQTEARNDVNGNDSSSANPSDVHPDGDINLKDLQNRLFDNQIARISCPGGSCGVPSLFDLDPALPAQPTPANALATPYGIALTGDDSTLLVTAMGTHRIFTASAANPASVLDRLDVGEIPKGVALVSGAGQATGTAYVLNTLGNTVTVVSVGVAGALAQVGAPIPVGDDPTPDAVRRGNIAFNNAFASDSSTFSCGSCHPDGNTDQLMWRIGAECFIAGCVAGEDEPRSTMPIRGLKNTLPLHWSGNLGDPFGGGNGDVGNTGNITDCTLGAGPNGDHACFLALVNAALSGPMCDHINTACPSGGNNLLTAQEADDMATFLASVTYPPARHRPIDDLITLEALQGFEDFFMDNPGNRGQVGVDDNFVSDPESCADTSAGCHELPLTAGTNSETLAGFDIPTMRGMYDRQLQFSAGITNPSELMIGANDGSVTQLLGFTIGTIPNPFGTWTTDMGLEEDFVFGVAYGAFDLVYGGSALTQFQMFEEASTGHSGALGRQVTLNPATATGGELAVTDALLAELEAADDRGVVNLRGETRWFTSRTEISYAPEVNASQPYRIGTVHRSRADVLAHAAAGQLVGTLTASLRSDVSESSLQPLLNVRLNSQCRASNGSDPVQDPALPVLTTAGTSMQLEGMDVTASDEVIVNGEPVVGGSVTINGGSSNCSTSFTPQKITVNIGTPLAAGTHLLQVRRGGMLSNELPFLVQ